MKKFLPLFLSLAFLTTIVKAQYVSIPDAGFKGYLQQQYPSCFNSSGMMDTTCSAIINETTLKVIYGVRSLDGIQYFKSLTYLDCSNAWLTVLPALPNSITYLDCSGNSLTTITSLPTSLTYLNCWLNQLTSLPALPSSLTYLKCTDNSLTALPSLPNSLTSLDCSMNAITTLPTLPNSLIYLNCSQNNLTLTILSSLPNLTYFNCSNIHSITALPSMPSLTYLDCTASNLLSSLPAIWPSNLKHLDCTGNSLTGNIPALPNSLTFFNCSFNNFSGSMPTLPPSLDTLACNNNPLLTSIPALPISLIVLSCMSNSISTLPSLPNSLHYLACPNNKLSQLPALPGSLNFLDCSNNKLTALPLLPGSLTYLTCSYNQIASLPILPDSLSTLVCSNNKLTGLPLLSNMLTRLECNSNQLTSLPSLSNSLNTLICGYNQLNSMPLLPISLHDLECYNNNIYCLPVLPDSLNTLYFDQDKIHCFPNNARFLGNILGFDSLGNSFPYSPSFNQFPLCNPTNNINHCQAFPIMDGRAFYDNNSNGIKDAGELYMPYVKMQLSNGSYTFTNNSGYYQIAAIDGTGTYTLFAYPPHYYKGMPTLMVYNFTNFDTLVTKNIAMQPTAFVDSLSLYTYNYQWAARPGFSFPVYVAYTNVGTTALSPAISFSYDNTRLTYDSSSNPNVVNNGSSLRLSETNFTPGQSNSFIAYFTAKPTDIIGDTIKTTASIAANAFTDTIFTATAISGSFDPNDKEATPQLTPEQVTKGKAINYTIHFQNTGNDTAFNIVIADTLSSLLQANTLQMISSSQPCKVTVTGNIVFFEFLNVLLPDNKTNDIGSNGYVSFSVQPQTSVSKGTIINNKASIYFDYNTPILTNTASTSIQEANSTVPVRLLSFTALTQQATNNTLLHWSTASEINTKSFVIEQSNDGIHFTTLATVPAKGYGANSYPYTVTDNATTYYRLKMIDNNGQYAYSKIVSVKSTQDAESITILNNPVVSFVTIKNNVAALANTEAKILDSHGSVVKRFTLQLGTQIIDVSNLPSGGYYIETLTSPLKFVIAR